MAFSDSAEELKYLQRSMSDLVSVLALPAVWSAQEPRQIVTTFHEALMATLNLDFLYTRARIETDGESMEILKTAPHYPTTQDADKIRHALNERSGDDPRKWPTPVRGHLGGQETSLLSMHLGIEGEIGIVVAGSERADFPTRSERLLLGVAANQVTAGLQQARLLSEQKRIADELEHQVAERTAKLVAANERLKREIDDRRRAEEALRASENNFRQIVDSIPGLVCTMDATGEIEQLNQPLLEYFGKTLEELKGWKMTDAVHPDDLPEVVKAYTHSVTTGTPYAIEHRCRRADGVYRWFQVRALAVHDTHNQICGWYVLLTDIEDRKRAEDELKRSEARYRVVVETASDAVVGIDESGAVILANPATKRLFGYTPEELIGKPLTVLMPGAMRKLHETGFKRYLETGTRHLNWQGTELTALRANGDEFPAEVSFGEMIVGRRRVFTGFIRDISEKKRSEEELRNTQAELAKMMRIMTIGQLTASIAHEVNQPLSGIVMNASTCLRMLSSDQPNIEGARETARRTIRDGNRASEVVTRLRALFKRKEVAAESMDLNDATREVLALSLSELQSNRILVSHDLAENLPTVKGDRVQIQQVILNLVRNASDAMRDVDHRPRQLLIKTECGDGNNVQLTVQDTGVGFASDAADRLFESFYTTKDDGMGIGLAVSRSIIEAHRGRLWASANDGPGSSFGFSIPCDYSAEPA